MLSHVWGALNQEEDIMNKVFYIGGFDFGGNPPRIIYNGINQIVFNSPIQLKSYDGEKVTITNDNFIIPAKTGEEKFSMRLEGYKIILE